MKNLTPAFKMVFRDPLYIFLALSLALNLLAIYYFIFLETTTLKVFFDSSTAFYNWSSIILTILISVFFGIAMVFMIWQWRQQKISEPSHLGNSFISSFLGAISIGCPVCGAYLASILGIAGGLSAFPFQGLEIKVISLGLMGFAIFSSAKSISNRACGISQEAKLNNLLDFENKKLVLNLNWLTIKPLIPAFIGFLLLFFVAYLPALANKFDFRVSFQTKSQANISTAISSEDSLAKNPGVDSSNLLQAINPIEGYTINATYGDLGPKLLATGVIDFEKMRALYERVGLPLTEEQIKILTQGSNEKIKITPENSYFLLNFLWALGLANKNQILDEGPMAKYKSQIGNFASTGGWTLGKKSATELYSKFEIIKLTPEQQKVLEDFAFNSYRPCCSNPTAFPDCNHGMAALALGEVMAAQGASADEIFEAFKYFNAFWFPQTYFDVATYFQAKEGKDWSQVPARIVASKDYSTPQGWKRVRQWLTQAGLLEEPPSGGGGCGV